MPIARTGGRHVEGRTVQSNINIVCYDNDASHVCNTFWTAYWRTHLKTLQLAAVRKVDIVLRWWLVFIRRHTAANKLKSFENVSNREPSMADVDSRATSPWLT